MGVRNGDTTLRTSNIRMATMTAAWALSLVCMCVGTLTDTPAQRAWGLWFALVACCFTGWAIVDYTCRKNAVRMETLAEIMAAEAERQHSGDANLSRIH